MNQIDCNQLTPDSTLEELVSYNFQVDNKTLGQVVSEKFQAQPELPGVIVTDGARIVGMISQNKFLERMRQPYSSEIYLKRSIQVFLDLETTEILQLPVTFKIEQAAKIALNRPSDIIYEPIVLIQEYKPPGLLNIRDLLLAQNQLIATVNTCFQQQHEQAHQYLQQLREEQEKSNIYIKLLENKQLDEQKKSRIMEIQQAELKKQTQRIYELNQQIVLIKSLISLEENNAFQATYAGIDSIFQTTKRILSIGNILRKDLDDVDSANNSIANFSKEVRHLALQAALAANKSGRQLSEFSYIANEIRSLGGKTFEASNQVNKIANQFKLRIQELTEAAQAGATTASSVNQKIQQAQVALAQLEELVSKQNQQQQQNSLLLNKG